MPVSGKESVFPPGETVLSAQCLALPTVTITFAPVPVLQPAWTNSHQTTAAGLVWRSVNAMMGLFTVEKIVFLSKTVDASMTTDIMRKVRVSGNKTVKADATA